MQLDLHQLELRYEALRKRSPRHERQLVASLSEVGQQLPIVVIGAAGGRFVVIDGYKRVRALRRLSRDTVRATAWEVAEVEALLLERLMRTAGEDALEQGWLLAELHERFVLSCDELARRFDKSKSWVSRRLALVRELPPEIQAQVRAGELAAYAAMKHLVPLARANAEVATRLCLLMAPLKPTTRQVGSLCDGWRSGTTRTRELILATPEVYLRAQEEQREAQAAAKSPLQQLLDDLGALSGITRRARRRLEQGLLQRLLPGEPEEVARVLAQTRADAQGLFTRFDQEAGDAG
ncbi:MAG: ParB N-terminal domain-containing protein [Acidobacteria bacterium]|nr:ParB N-terminal domain-containing protein [Acidobacteriota bacterium]